MTDAPSRTGRAAGSSNGAVAPARERAAQARRRYPPERRRRAAARRRRLRGLSRLALLVLVVVVTVWVGARVANATSNGPVELRAHLRGAQQRHALVGGAPRPTRAATTRARSCIASSSATTWRAPTSARVEVLVLPILSE